jgi:hypothetical protein
MSNITKYLISLLTIAIFLLCAYNVYSQREEYITVYRVRNINNMPTNELEKAIKEYSNYISRVDFSPTNTADNIETNKTEKTKDFHVVITNRNQLVELFRWFVNSVYTNEQIRGINEFQK